MKIAQIAPVWYPIPPKGYGGIELVVSLLAEGLTAAGHDVTLFASGDSETSATLKWILDAAPSEKIGQVYPDLLHATNAYGQADDFDIIHDHSGMIGPAIGAFSGLPVLHTLHGPATENSKQLYRLLNPGLYYNSISEYQRRMFGDLNFVGTIYNAVDLNSYPYGADKDDYLMFLGRMNPEKGAHVAVEIANRLGRRLRMVTKMTEPHEKAYFKEKVEPLLKSNTEVIGEIDVATKADMFRHAACTLFPIQWPEPFGLVMIESMAAGTPVVAMGRGAVPEVMENGRTGFIVETTDQMVEAVGRIGEIDPEECRRYVEERFSRARMVADYEKAYERIIGAERRKVAGLASNREMTQIQP